MLDVHPPHESAHSWTDFFIHIATIVVGLLIAVGLEQTVEMIHHRHSVQEAREHIRNEAEVNQRIQREDEKHVAELLARLHRNLDVLSAVGTERLAPDATLDFSWQLQDFFDAAYTGAKQSGDLSRMPYDESAQYQDAYTDVALNTEAMIDLIKQIYAVKALLHDRRLSELSPADVKALETSMSEAIGKADYYNLLLTQNRKQWETILSGHFRNDLSGTGR